jgi:hypothetical protein
MYTGKRKLVNAIKSSHAIRVLHQKVDLSLSEERAVLTSKNPGSWQIQPTWDT